MLPFPFSLYRYFFPRRGHAIDIPSVKVYEIDTAPEKPARALKHLLKLNHANHSILYNERRFHNHAPHVCTLPFLFFSPHNFFFGRAWNLTSHLQILSSTFLLGGTVDDLNRVYDAEAKQLEKWTDSPSEISSYDWRDHLGRRE